MKAIAVGKRDTPSRSAGFKVPARILCESFPEMDAMEHTEIKAYGEMLASSLEN